MKIMVTMIPTNFITNFYLFLFCLFVEAENKKQVGVLATINIHVFCL